MSISREIERTIDALTKRIQLLEDYVAICQNTAQYGPNADYGDADATADLWTEDGVYDAVNAITMHGRQAIGDMVRGEGHRHGLTTGCGHVLTAPHVVLQGDRAEGRSYALKLYWDESLQRFWVGRLSANRWRWERTPQGWKVAERINANLDGRSVSRELFRPIADHG